jgi:hypothetical protein
MTPRTKRRIWLPEFPKAATEVLHSTASSNRRAMVLQVDNLLSMAEDHLSTVSLHKASTVNSHLRVNTAARRPVHLVNSKGIRDRAATVLLRRRDTSRRHYGVFVDHRHWSWRGDSIARDRKQAKEWHGTLH